MKKFFSLVLALVMALSLTTVAWGADTVTTKADLADKFANNCDVKLGANIVFNDQELVVPHGKVAVLDLNGYEISFTGAYKLRVVGTLTVKDTSADGDGSIVGSTSAPTVQLGRIDDNLQPGATLNLLSGSIVNNSGNYAAIQGNGTTGTNSNQNTTIVISGGKVTATSDAIYHPQAGSLTVSGGEITGYTGIAMKSGKLTITGGTIKGTGAYMDTLTSSQNGIETDGSAICIDSNVGYAGGMEVNISGNAKLVSANSHIIREGGVDNEITSISVTGGTFTAAAGKEAINLQDTTPAATASVSGGSFNTDVSEYLAAGKTLVSDGAGGYVIVEESANSWNALYGKKTSAGSTIGAVTLEYYKAVAPVYDDDGVVTNQPSIAYYLCPELTGTTYLVEVTSLGAADVVVYNDVDGRSVFKYLDIVYNVEYEGNGVAFTNFGKACGQYKDANYDKTATYYTFENVVYKAVEASATALMVNGKLVPVVAATGAVVPHIASYTYNDKFEVTAVKCGVCGAAATIAPNYASLPDAVKAASANNVINGNMYFYWGAAATVTPGTTVESAETFDVGIAMYVGMSIMAAAGSAVVIGKKKD